MKKLLLLLCMSAVSLCAAVDLQREDPETYWDIDLLKITPTYRKAAFPDSEADGLQAILIKGFGPFKGDKKIAGSKPNPLSTKVSAEFFAYMGFPDTPMPKGGYPGVVLIHGGGGTAYAHYAKRWVAKGFAVIMLDWYNRRPVPPGPEGGKTKLIPLEGGARQDHVANVANMILAHTVLRSQKNVNPDKTAFVGLSWGSWYGAMVASIDTRFKGGVEIYCGDIREHQRFTNGRFHHAIKIPLYWIVSTNDQHMTVESITKAFKRCPTTYNRSIVVRLPHAHVGFDFECCPRMVSHFVGDAPNLPKLSDIKVVDGVASAEILDRGKGITEAFLCYTDSTEPVYHKRVWKKLPAAVKGNIVSAKVPEKAHSYYLTVYEGKSRFHTFCGSTDVVVTELKK